MQEIIHFQMKSSLIDIANKHTASVMWGQYTHSSPIALALAEDDKLSVLLRRSMIEEIVKDVASELFEPERKIRPVTDIILSRRSGLSGIASPNESGAQLAFRLICSLVPTGGIATGAIDARNIVLEAREELLRIE